MAGKAAAGLEDSSDIKSRTLHSYQYRWQNEANRLNVNDVFVIDEAGMVGSRQMNFFVQEIEKVGAKLVLVGDSGQLQPIAAGGAFKAITDITNPAKITEIRRQKVDWQRQASMDFANGEIENGLRTYEEKGCIHKSEDEKTSIQNLVDNYIADLNNDIDNKQSSRLILAHRRKHVAKLNKTVRQALIAKGKLNNEQEYETANGIKKFAAGDRILFTKNDNELSVKNGTLGTVVKTEDRSVTIQPDDNAKPVKVDFNAYNSLDYGYAVTIHKSQGATVDKTWLFANKTMDQHLMYVAGTRHTKALKVYTGLSDQKDILHSKRWVSKQYQKPISCNFRMMLSSRVDKKYHNRIQQIITR